MLDQPTHHHHFLSAMERKDEAKEREELKTARVFFLYRI